MQKALPKQKENKIVIKNKKNSLLKPGEIFDIENGTVIINHNCLSVPELKAICEEYEDPIPALNFLHHKYSPKGPYCNVEEDIKDEVLLNDFPGDYTLEDSVMIAAIAKLDALMVTPTY